MIEANIQSKQFTKLSGWVADRDNDGVAIELSIEINGTVVETLKSNTYNPQARKKGFGDGKYGFDFDPSPYLNQAINDINIRAKGAVLKGGSFSLLNVSLAEQDPQSLSQHRWKGDEGAEHLTWGRILSGDSFIEALEDIRKLRDEDSILEVGPGYGRLLLEIIKRGLPFSSYTGLELSQTRVERLNNEFGGKKVDFICGDVNYFSTHNKVDVVICSSTFEHLYPNFRSALRSLHSNLKTQGIVFIDFIHPKSNNGGTIFADHNGTYIRVYNKLEIENIFTDIGFEIITSKYISFGSTIFRKGIERLFVSARKAK